MLLVFIIYHSISSLKYFVISVLLNVIMSEHNVVTKFVLAVRWASYANYSRPRYNLRSMM
jgi:hypothetical protein